jgi:hypothetical protein
MIAELIALDFPIAGLVAILQQGANSPLAREGRADQPLDRRVRPIIAEPMVCGPHHRYARV